MVAKSASGNRKPVAMPADLPGNQPVRLPAHYGRQDRFDATELPAPDRLAAWNEQINSRIAGFALDPLGAEPFYGVLEAVNFGPVRIHRETCAPARWRRTARQTRDGIDTYSLFLGASGPFCFAQGDVAGTCLADSYAITDHTRESDMFVKTGGVDYDITIERDALVRSQRDPDRIARTQLGPQGSTLRLLRHYIDSIFDAGTDLSDPVICQKVGEHIFDLIALSLQPKRDAEAEASERGLRSARVKAILDVIHAHYSDERLSTAMVAARLNMSERYVHRLLAEQGVTFSRQVMELRLRKAAALLAEPEFDGWRIGQIAYECGFSDLSYFNRCFRRRFGDTPAGVRSGRTLAI